MTNTARGDAGFLANGEQFVMRLTLGALAEIEHGLGLDNLGQIADRLKNFNTGDLATIAAALLRAGGHSLTAADVMKLPADLATIVGAVADAFNALGLSHAAKTQAETTDAPLSGAAGSNSASA
ncbi:MAG TPA: GTA-gp10 family protein [Rhizomicrobium sp.]